MTRIAIAILCVAGVASAAPKHKSSRFDNPADADTTPAVHYAALSQADCEAELATRKISFEREVARGVLAPVRVKSALHGIVFRTDLADKARATTPYEIADCRLVLALDDFAELLSHHDIIEVRHYSIYRPPAKSWPDGKLAQQHNGALAIDAGKLIKSDGTSLEIKRDFHGAIGAKTCGDGAAPKPVTPAATELRTILCDAVALHLFNVVLTPNFNRPHNNHFHLEVTPGVKWFLVH